MQLVRVGLLGVLEQLESVTQAIIASGVSNELRDFQQSVEHLLFNPENREMHLTAFVDSAQRIKDAAGEGQKLVGPLVDHMTGFVREMGAPSPVQLEVVKLHIEAMDAIMEGRAGRQLDGTRLLQMLQKAVEMSNGEPDPFELM